MSCGFVSFHGTVNVTLAEMKNEKRYQGNGICIPGPLNCFWKDRSKRLAKQELAKRRAEGVVVLELEGGDEGRNGR